MSHTAQDDFCTEYLIWNSIGGHVVEIDFIIQILQEQDG